MYKYILESAGNINWMAIFALLTFFTIFLMSIWLVFRDSKEYIQKMEHLPLEDDATESTYS
ncbi:MAG: hypothetical protein IPM26_14970 [Saprospiraceae bacterium]|nr:hypothetical protein [Saprospiraceae bacterium]